MNTIKRLCVYVYACILSILPFSSAIAEKQTWNPYLSIFPYALTIDVGQGKYGHYAKKALPKKYTGIGIAAGVMPFEYLGFELSYLKNGNTFSEGVAVNINGDPEDYSANIKSEASFDLWTAKTILAIPIPVKGMRVFGSIGVGSLSYRIDASGKTASPDGESGLVRISKKGKEMGVPLGVGLSYRGGGDISTRLEYTRFTLKKLRDRDHSQMIAVHIIVHF